MKASTAVDMYDVSNDVNPSNQQHNRTGLRVWSQCNDETLTNWSANVYPPLPFSSNFDRRDSRKDARPNQKETQQLKKNENIKF